MAQCVTDNVFAQQRSTARGASVYTGEQAGNDALTSVEIHSAVTAACNLDLDVEPPESLRNLITESRAGLIPPATANGLWIQPDFCIFGLLMLGPSRQNTFLNYLVNRPDGIELLTTIPEAYLESLRRSPTPIIYATVRDATTGVLRAILIPPATCVNNLGSNSRIKQYIYCPMWATTRAGADPLIKSV